MRNLYRIALVSVLAFSLAAATSELSAQTTRSTTTTSRTTNSSSNRSSNTTAAPSRSTASRSASTGTSRSTGSAVSRQSASSSSKASAPAGSSSSQVRRSTGSTPARSTSNGSAASGTTAKRQVNTGSSSSSSRSTATMSAPARTVSASSSSSGSESAQTVTRSRVTRSNANATSSKGLTSARAAVDNQRSGEASASANKAARENEPLLNYRGGRPGDMRMDGNRNLNRIPPRERGFMTYDVPGSFYAPAPHFFGYRVEVLPPRYRRITRWGVEYYYYDNIYYRRYGKVYVVSRPPFGVAVDIALHDLAFATVRFSYYHNVYRTFDVLDDNYRTIAEQNRIIASNNATIASQNKTIALNSSRAESAYDIAHALGLVQSYANIDKDYFYQDGVFYIENGHNRYEVIVPPAGALVDELPDDYDTLVLNGVEYYKVDDTVYRLILVEGVPALEVLGQMYGSMARQYNYYYE